MLLVLERLTSVIFVTIFVSYYPVQLPFQKVFAVFINTEQKKKYKPWLFSNSAYFDSWQLGEGCCMNLHKENGITAI